MAEYIDRDKACARRERNKDLCPICQDRFGCRVNNLPTADVIEREKYEKLHKEYEHYRRLAEQDNNLRSKVDEAVKELRKEIEENHLNVIDYADGEWIVKDFVYGAIERFKKNIGE